MKFLILLVGAAVAALFGVDRIFRSRTQRLRDSGLIPPAGRGTEADVERLVRARRKIEAIKLYREVHGGGLKEAKEAVEAMAARIESEHG